MGRGSVAAVGKGGAQVARTAVTREPGSPVLADGGHGWGRGGGARRSWGRGTPDRGRRSGLASK